MGFENQNDSRYGSAKDSENPTHTKDKSSIILPTKSDIERRRFASVVEKTNGGDIAKIAELMQKYDPLKIENEIQSEEMHNPS